METLRDPLHVGSACGISAVPRSKSKTHNAGAGEEVGLRLDCLPVHNDLTSASEDLLALGRSRTLVPLANKFGRKRNVWSVQRGLTPR